MCPMWLFSGSSKSLTWPFGLYSRSSADPYLPLALPSPWHMRNTQQTLAILIVLHLSSDGCGVFRKGTSWYLGWHVFTWWQGLTEDTSFSSWLGRGTDCTLWHVGWLINQRLLRPKGPGGCLMWSVPPGPLAEETGCWLARYSCHRGAEGSVSFLHYFFLTSLLQP